MEENEMVEKQVLAPFTLQQLLGCCGGDWDFMADLAGTFYDDTANLLEEARQACQLGDAAALRRAAHSLKSNAASFGAELMRQMCKDLEEMGKAGDLSDAGSRLEQIGAEFEQVRSALQEVIERRSLNPTTG